MTTPVQEMAQAGLGVPGQRVASDEDVLISARDGSGNTWTRAEIAELARDLRDACGSKVMSGEKMRDKDTYHDLSWCRHRMTYAALALESLAAKEQP